MHLIKLQYKFSSCEENEAVLALTGVEPKSSIAQDLRLLPTDSHLPFRQLLWLVLL